VIIVPLTARKGVVVSLTAMGRFFYFFGIVGALDRAARRPDRLRNRQSSLAGLICVLARFRTRRGYFPPNRPKRRQTGSQRPRNRFSASLRPTCRLLPSQTSPLGPLICVLTRFRLFKVKIPSDSLKTRQIASQRPRIRF
jgi:hypothetical protein